jgi:hypothetical protein
VAVTDRFLSPIILQNFPSEAAAQEMIKARLAQSYAEYRFTPPHASWPFARRAFATTAGFSPRQLLKACEDHRQSCLTQGKVFELQSFQNQATEPPQLPPSNEFERLYETAKRDADLAKVLEPHDEDRPFGNLLTSALDLFVMQTALPEDVDLVADAETSRRPVLHGRLTFTYRSEGDRERHYCFRVISPANAIAFQVRLKAAMTAPGVDRGLKFRHLFIVRQGSLPGGPKTAQLVQAFQSAGGKIITPLDDDLRALIALRNLREEKHEGFLAWLRARRPLCGLALFEAAGLCGETNFDTACAQSVTQSQGDDLSASRKALPKMVKSVPAAMQAVGQPEEEQPAVLMPPVAAVNGVSIERVISIGRRLEADGLGRPLSIPADLLPRRIAILGGSGSGKTVLLRRIIEEAALLGIPAIVLDTNNDLVLLGRAWPQLPNDFTKADAAKAAVWIRTKIDESDGVFGRSACPSWG